MIPIDKGVPIPKTKRSRSGVPNDEVKYPFRYMDVGDSFLVSTTERRKVQALLGSLCRRYQPKQFVTRQLTTGVRCWRIA